MADGTLGEIYARVVDFVARSADALQRQGAPVRDLIDFPELSVLPRNAATTPAWLFQANPKYYDISAAVSALPAMNWTVAQSINQIRAGDRVYIWQSGEESGILAVGTILTDPALLPDQEGRRSSCATQRSWRASKFGCG